MIRFCRVIGIRLAFRIKLEQRVDVHDLNSGQTLETLSAETVRELFIEPDCARIPITGGVRKPFSILVEQDIIDSPGIDRHRIRLHLRRAFGKSGFDVCQQGIDIPAQNAVHFAAVVRKTGNLDKVDPARIRNRASHDPAASGSDINRQTVEHNTLSLIQTFMNSINHPTDAPPGKSGASTVTSRRLSPFFAARSIPYDSTPRIFAGFRFATSTIVLPISSSGV